MPKVGQVTSKTTERELTAVGVDQPAPQQPGTRQGVTNRQKGANPIRGQ